MKLVGVIPPEPSMHELLPDIDETRSLRLSLLGFLVILLCIGILAGGTYSYLLGSLGEGVRHVSRARQVPEKRAAAAATVGRPLVRLLDESQSLKKGDLVVLRPNSFSAPVVRQIAAAPNEALVIRRAGAIDGFYMVGASGYLVMSDEDSIRIVRLEEIAGTLVSGLNQ